METIRFELKYCERCGTLKLRPVASATTYCRRCEGLLTRFGGRVVTKHSAHRFPAGLRMAVTPPKLVAGEGLTGRMQ